MAPTRQGAKPVVVSETHSPEEFLMTTPTIGRVSSIAARAAASSRKRAPTKSSGPDKKADEPSPPTGPTTSAGHPGLRIGDVAARAGVSTRTLRYYEELGLLGPSRRTVGGERRYRDEDVVQLERIVELKALLGMNLEEIRELLSSRARIDELRAAYRAHEAAPAVEANGKRRTILEEALALETSLVERMDAKLKSLAAFRAKAQADAERCATLLLQLD
jgi:DNA-binding transcriptional MerR regulator